MPSIRPKSVLCVDDNQYGLEIRKQMLELFGFAVQTAESGELALKRMESATFDLAVIDFHMSGMDGAELVQHIRRRYPDVPIIMLTGYPHDVPPHTLQLVDKMIVKGGPAEELVDAVFHLTGLKRHLPVAAKSEKKALFRRNIDHVDAVKKFLRKEAGHRH